MKIRLATVAAAALALPLGALAQTSTGNTNAQAGAQAGAQLDATTGAVDESSSAIPSSTSGTPPGETGTSDGTAADQTVLTDTTSEVAGVAPNVQISGTADFVPLAMSSNRYEIEASRLARDKATRDDVKAFASQMIEDHKAAGETMQAATKADGIDLPQTMSKTHAAQLQKLTDATGSEFDRIYVEEQVRAHEEAVALFAACAQSCDEGQVKAKAAELLPKLQDHLQKAKALVTE